MILSLADILFVTFVRYVPYIQWHGANTQLQDLCIISTFRRKFCQIRENDIMVWWYSQMHFSFNLHINETIVMIFLYLIHKEKWYLISIIKIWKFRIFPKAVTYHDNGFKIENNLLFWYIPTLNDLAFLKEINLIWSMWKLLMV